MALFNVNEVRARARAERSFTKSIDAVILEHVKSQQKEDAFDVFMSHAFDDKELVLGTALMIEDLGYTVYMDWREDPQLSRKHVTKANAEVLRKRLRASESLFYATTKHSPESSWMSWELGFMDGFNTRAAIVPIVDYASKAYEGQEYLGMYPYVTHSDNRAGKHTLWIRESETKYVSFDQWVLGTAPHVH